MPEDQYSATAPASAKIRGAIVSRAERLVLGVRSKRGAVRRYNAIIAKYRRDFAGGGMFGFDYPTMRSNAPEAYQALAELKALFPYLPE